ncbi:MAG: Conserved domain associated with flavoprotein oxygenases, DIM6/NTAB family [uncultured Aureispira sp.]|uniref:Conserved domain associated with flavoprotein oxygenases, DIM6/NTAB family n=1 Tax=uncultured Aureispira sp. TaxID=1331704 RepID=A0A6S6UJG1_9BACT|nr:MAG: Conserved domain associated with flavoprotein oxygenases, DIM6/NTAB family [uncultured Aureispira sp.]
MSTRVIQREELSEMEHLFRINLVNSITGYKSANLIGTIDEASQQTNLAVFSSVTHFGSAPPLLGFVLRPTTVFRGTYNNIKKTGYYTINHVNASIIEAAHHTSAKYPAEVSEFDQTNLTAAFENGFLAPYVKEATIKIGVEFKQEIPIALNGTILILGQIKELIVPDECLLNDGFLDLNAAETVTVSGLDAYHLPKRLARFEYARPNQPIKKILD